MSYEKYRIIQTKDEFWAAREKDKRDRVDDTLKDYVYRKYFLKAVVFQRDQFTCQNNGCGSQDKLTMHHIKFQKNNGGDKPKNCVTICKPCHDKFHKGHQPLTFWGMTYKMHKDDTLNWKELKKQAKELRKAAKEYHGYKISWEWVCMMLKWLESDYNVEDSDDDA